MLLSDWIGGAGGILLAIPAVKDQYYRFKRDAQERKEASSPLPNLRQVLGVAWEKRRNGYEGPDSLMTLAGALAIALSFVLKLFEL